MQNLSDAEIEDIAARLTAALADAAFATQTAAALKAELRDALGATTKDVGPYRISITPTRRFDPDRARTVLPPEWLSAVTREVIDASAAKAALPPTLYAACQSEGALAVRVQ